MNALDMLLGNEDLLEVPEKKYKVKRLSKNGVDFELNLRAISMDTLKHINELNTHGKDKEADQFGIQISTLAYGVKEFDMHNSENAAKLQSTLKKLGVPTVEQFVNKLLLPGEIALIAMAIVDLSGADDSVEEVKNE